MRLVGLEAADGIRETSKNNLCLMVLDTLPNETKTMKLARPSELVDIIMLNGGHLAKT